MEYYIRYIPCEAKEYNVTTAITLIKPINNQIIFSKTYSTNTSDNVCYDRYFYDYPYMPAHLTAHSDKFRVNSQLADSISNAILDDISPHYIYFDVEIMEELNAPDIEYEKDGSVILYYKNQSIDITHKFNKDNICYVKLVDGDDSLYVTVKYNNGYASSPNKYISPWEFN